MAERKSFESFFYILMVQFRREMKKSWIYSFNWRNCAVKSDINLWAFNVAQFFVGAQGMVKFQFQISKINGVWDVKTIEAYRTTACFPLETNKAKWTFGVIAIFMNFLLQNLKDQILTTNIWLEHEWQDHKFKWDPVEYGGVTELYVPSEHIWLPDIVLYNK